MPIKYKNPFNGKKKPLHLGSLFLIHPDIILKLSDLSMSGIMKDIGFESIYKRSKNRDDDKVVKRLVNDMVERVPNLPKDIIYAAKGNAEAQGRIETIGMWEAFMIGYETKETDWPPQIKFLISIERATDQPYKLFHDREYNRAVYLLQNHPFLSKLFWPESIDILRIRDSLTSILPLRGLIALEVLLGYLAAFDAHICYSIKKSDSITFDVLPTSLTSYKNPTALLFEYIKKQTGLKSISEMLDAYQPDTKEESQLNESLLKRWSNGSHMPSEDTFLKILKSFFPDNDPREFWMRHYAAKCLNLIGYEAQKLQTISNISATNDLLKDALRPLPDLPFGYKTTQSWFENRYPFWFKHHRQEIEREGIKPSHQH